MTRQFRYSLTLGAALLATGIAGMFILFQFREPPAEASTGTEERRLDVEVTTAEPVSHTITVEGFGAARSAVLVSISPEVSGRIVYANPRMRVGERVGNGELLVRLDDERYNSMVAEREAQIGEIEAEIARLKATERADSGRVVVLMRTQELARLQFERSRTLLAEHVGNQLEVDRSEQAYNEAADRLRQLQTVLATYPMAIQEAENRLQAARAGLERAKLDRARTEICAPFAGRVDAVLVGAEGNASPAGSPAVAAGHYAEAGRPLLVLADATNFEVPIKLDARDAYEWLLRSESADGASVAPVECTVTWTEMESGPTWTGTLDRIEHYDAASRTITAVVGVDLTQQAPGTFPLADGMFCSVRLPGSTLEQVFAVPVSSLSVDGTVYVASDGRLESRPVRVVRTEGSTAYVDSGIQPGDLVVTTRLVNPVNNTLLRIASNDMTSAE